MSDDYLADIYVQGEVEQKPAEPEMLGRRKKRSVMEAEQRQVGLSTAIAPDSIGHRLLKKMGYNPEGESQSEAVAKAMAATEIQIKPNRTGLGRDAQLQQQRVKLQQQRSAVAQKHQTTFLERKAQSLTSKFVHIDLKKCKTVCENLDTAADVDVNPLWSEATKVTEKTSAEGREEWNDRAVLTEYDPAAADEESDSEAMERLQQQEESRMASRFEDDPRSFPSSSSSFSSSLLKNPALPRFNTHNPFASTQAVLSPLEEEALLAELLHYMRGEYRYCFYCAVKYDDEEDMNKNCPGVDRAAHDV